MRFLFYAFLVFLLPSCQIFKTPEFKDFRNFKVSKLGLRESTLTMELVYYNPNKYGFNIRKSNIDLYVDGIYLGNSTSDSLIKVDKLSEFSIPISLNADMANVIKNAWNLLVHKSVLVKAKGTVSAGAKGFFKTFEVDYEGRHELNLLD